MDDTRKPRNLETRQQEKQESRESDDWKPPSLLADPAPQDGWVFRWVRTGLMQQDDPMNVSMKMREGWVPVKAEDHPELAISAFKGNIQQGGLMLMKMSAKKDAQRNEHYRNLAHGKIESVNSNLDSENDPRLPTLRREKNKSRVTFGNGT